MSFVLELQEYHLEYETFIHKGYVNIVFTSRELASEYLSNEKSQFIKLVSSNGWKSNVINNHRYVIREYYGEKCTIEPF